MGLIYRVTNTINGKIYIGKTVQDLKDRWSTHIQMARQGRTYHFANAIRKYGQEAFELSVLETVEDEVLLGEREKFWIAELNATDAKVGYNSTYGGEGFASGDLNPNRLNPRRGEASGSYGRPVPEDVRKRISETLIGQMAGEKNPFFGKKHTDETKQHLSDIQRGQKRKAPSDSTREKIRRRMVGRVFSPETLEKMRQAKLGKQPSEEHRAKLREAQKARRIREAAKRFIPAEAAA